MKKRLTFILITLTLCVSVFVGGCSCSKKSEPPTNPNANVILATSITLDKNVVEDATIGEPFTITYTIAPSNTTDKTMIISSSDNSIATVDKTEVTGATSSTITVTPMGVGTCNIIFTWSGTFDNDVESEDRVLKKATTVYVTGETGKETLTTPTSLTYSNGKFTWNKVTYGTDGITESPRYELSLTGGASPLDPITLEDNEYEFALTKGVTYTAKVKAKPTLELQNLFTASAYSEEIEVYKLSEVDSLSVSDGVVQFDKVDKANKYIINVNGEDKQTIESSDDTITCDIKPYLTDGVTEAAVKVKAINDEDDLVFDSEYSVNNVTIYRLGVTSNFAISLSQNKSVLNFDDVDHATKYIIELSGDGVGETRTETVTTNSYTLPTDITGTYKVRVKATGEDNTIDGEYSDYFDIEVLDVSDVEASVENDIITYNVDSLNGDKIVFTILSNTADVEVEKTTSSGTINVKDYISSNSYIVLVKLVPVSNNLVVSTSKLVGQNFELSLQNDLEGYVTNIVWDFVTGVKNYVLEISNGGSQITLDKISNVSMGKVAAEVPSELTSGSHTAKVKAVLSNDVTTEFGLEFTFNKLNSSDVTPTLEDNVLSVSTLNEKINKVVVYVSGVDFKVYTLTMEQYLEFANLYLESGTYDISFKAMSDDENYAIGDEQSIEQQISVIKNPEVTKISEDGTLTWNADTNYGSYKIYVDYGTDDQQILSADTNQVKITTLTTGEHTAYVIATPINNYIASAKYYEFTFTKLGQVSNVQLVDNTITWDDVADTGGYEVKENTKNATVVDSTTFTPTEILDSNTYIIKPYGNGQDTVTGEEYSITFNRTTTVTDLGILDGYINYTEEEDVTYTMYVDDDEVENGKSYKFTGATPYEIMEVKVIAKKDGYFDSDFSDVLKVKKLGLPTDIVVTSSDKETYTVSWTSVTGANAYLVTYNQKSYNTLTNSITITGELADGDYQVTVQAIFTGSELQTDTDTFGYVNGDVAEAISFTKLKVPTDVKVENGKLVWQNESVAAVSRFDIEYSDNEGDTWTTKALTSELTSDLEFLDAGTYLVKVRAVGNDKAVLSSDYTAPITVTKLNTVSNLKVKNGEIVWDAYNTEDGTYLYDVYIYQKVGGSEVEYDTMTDLSDTTIEIEGISENTEYLVKVVVKNASGVEVDSKESSALTVVKLNTPTNFALVEGVASWDKVKVGSEVATRDYAVILETTGQDDLTYDVNDTDESDTKDSISYQIPNNINIKTKYTLYVLAYGTKDSTDTMKGYLNSDVSMGRLIYKLSAVTDLKIENGVIVWKPNYSDDDEYYPMGYKLVFTKYEVGKDGGVETHESEVSVASNVTSYDMAGCDAGDYKLELYSLGTGTETINSLAAVLGDPERFKKLATPSSLHMQDGELVWTTDDDNLQLTFVIYNDNEELTTIVDDDLVFTTNEESPNPFNITIQAELDGAVSSDVSDLIVINKLTKVTGFTLHGGKFKWDRVDNATGYTIVLSYTETQTDPDTGAPQFDADGQPIEIEKTTEITVDGGNTTEVAVPITVPHSYKVTSVFATGNTTSSNTEIGYFNSNPLDSEIEFVALTPVTGLTTRDGKFVWNTVQGAKYYTLNIYTVVPAVDPEGEETYNLVNTISTANNSYTLQDSDNIPKGNYKLEVTPISVDDTYVTTYVPTEMKFSKLDALTNVRVENGYLAWNVLKQDLVDAYYFDYVPTEEGEEPPTYSSSLFDTFYSVAVGRYSDNSDTARLYSYAYIKINLTSQDNSKNVTKTVQPFQVVDPGGSLNYVTCYYFVDVEEDTWKISIASSGNTVNPNDSTSIRYVDGVGQAKFITAKKLSAPLSPVHYDTTPIVDGYLVFTPVRNANGELYTKYIVEAVPTNLPVYPIITYLITDVNDASTYSFDVQLLKLRNDIPYNISVKTLGSENGTSADELLYLNSNTPVTTSLVILGVPSFTISQGVVGWNESAADTYTLKLRNESGTINETHELESTVTKFELDSNYPADTYYFSIKANGNGVDKISSAFSSEVKVVKPGTIDGISLSNGEFTWAHNPIAVNGYKVEITSTRDTAGGTQEVLTEVVPVDQIEDDASFITFALPSKYNSYIVEEGQTFYYKYSIRVAMLGTVSGTGAQSNLSVNSEFGTPSIAYQRLNTPTNVRVVDGQIIWNHVNGASGYQIYISGNNIDTEGNQVVVDEELNVGGALSYTLDDTFKAGVYYFKVKALAPTPSMQSPAAGYITSNYSPELIVVRVSEPELRVDRGEVAWNTNDQLPFEATAKVKFTINETETIIDNLENAGFDFDNPLYPAGEYTISVQFLGNNELIHDILQEDGEELDFYYVGSEVAEFTFIKQGEPTISLGKVTVEVDGSDEQKNAVRWNAVGDADKYDVYIVTTTTELQGEDLPDTPEDDRIEVEVDVLEKYTPEESDDFGSFEESGHKIYYFLLQNISYEDYRVYVRTVGDDESLISSTRSNELHIHIPRPPTNFAYDRTTGTISWENASDDSVVVLDVRKYNEGSGEYDTTPGEVELPSGTTTYKLGEIGQYKVRVKSRLKIIGGDLDSEFNDDTLIIAFDLFEAGSGTTNSPYQVKTEEHLYNIRYFMDRQFTLVSDGDNTITLNAYSNWTMIGNANTPFTGTINGNGVTIKNIQFNDPTYTNVAFIYKVDTSSTIQNLKLEITVNKDNYSTRTEFYGGIAIRNDGNIRNCEVSGNVDINGTVTNYSYFGGIVKDNYGTITDTINKSNVLATRNSGDVGYRTYVGGIAAQNFGTITRSGNEGTLRGQIVGGITAQNYNDVLLSYNLGSLNAISSGYTSNIILGGIVANNLSAVDGDGTIDRCYVIMLDNQLNIQVTTNTTYAGGIVGSNNNPLEGCISNCYALLGEYTQSGTGANNVTVGILAGNISGNGITVNNYYKVFNNCYVYSTRNSTVATGAGNTLSKTGLNTNHSGLITNISNLSDGTSVNIPDMTVSDSNGYMPRFTWQSN